MERLRQDWKKQKAVIKNIANYPIIPKDTAKRRRAISKAMDLGYDSSAYDVELVRLIKIDGVSILVTIRLNSSSLVIVGELQ